MIYIGNKLVAEKNDGSVVKWPDDDSSIDAQNKLVVGANNGKMLNIPTLQSVNNNQIWYIKGVTSDGYEWGTLPITDEDIGKYLGVDSFNKLAWVEL